LTEVRKGLEQFGPVFYCPKVYRGIKKQLPGRQFFVCDDDDNPYGWREVAKRELVDFICKYYKEAQHNYDLQMNSNN
jgi:glutamate racemase